MGKLETWGITPPAAIRAGEVIKRLNGAVRSVGAEIGVFTGQMSAELLKRPGLFLYMVDSWAPNEKQPERYKQSGDYHAELSEREQLRNYFLSMVMTEFAEDRRKVLKMSSVDAAERVADGELDFVFIDADHSYKGCREDIEIWRPKVKAGGILSGHDYGNRKFAGFGVDRAVNEAVKENGWELELGEHFTWFVRT